MKEGSPLATSRASQGRNPRSWGIRSPQEVAANAAPTWLQNRTLSRESLRDYLLMMAWGALDCP